MLQIGSPKIKILSEELNGKEIEGVTFEVASVEGLTMKVKHDAGTDTEAKAILKRYIPTVSGMQTAYTNIQLIDESGRIL